MTVTVSHDRRDGGSGQRWGPPRRVKLRRRPGAPLGVSIVGGKVDIIAKQNGESGDEKAIFGIFIKNVVPNSPAALSGDLQTGDRILEVDGVCVRTAQHERAVELIKAAKDVVTLTVQSLMTWITVTSEPEVEKELAKEAQKENEKTTEEKQVNGEKPPSKPVYSDSESSDDEDERELQGRTYTDKGVEIDRASAGAIKRSREEKEADPEEEDEFGYTTSKWRDTLFALVNFSFYIIHVYFYACIVVHN
ncbi:unnamed protein product [Euphydryas editha]|uniref:PDZ domain-containing protein n=1 Tax=Euphydryas editha TaxID=104508 RepID=A0AAU9UH57_EUPED|nr:unnamed protein product [Euphydryas editha]